VGEERAEHHDSATVHDDAHLAPEEWYSLSERSVSACACASTLRVSRGTSFPSFRVGATGADGVCTTIHATVRCSTDMGTCTMDAMRDGIACHAGMGTD
jgi:hypothetical protein